MLTVEAFTTRRCQKERFGAQQNFRDVRMGSGSLCAQGEPGGRSSAAGQGRGLWNVAALSVCALSVCSLSCARAAAGHIEIPVLRQGPDLSTPTSVWCATRTSDPPSASPGVDYVPSSRKIEFRPGKTEEVRSHLDSCWVCFAW